MTQIRLAETGDDDGDYIPDDLVSISEIIHYYNFRYAGEKGSFDNWSYLGIIAFFVLLVVQK